MVLPVSDKGRAGGQEVSMQLLPGPKHPLRGGLLQAHAEIQGLLTVREWRLRAGAGGGGGSAR